MSQQANVTVFDGAAAPVSHTLVPVGNKAVKQELIAEWREMLTTVPAYAQIKARTSIVRMNSGIYRVSVTAEVPVMESVSGANAAGYTASPKIAYTNVVQFVGYFHERSTIAERRLARQLLVNFLNNVTVTTPAATTGPVSELVDQLVHPS